MTRRATITRQAYSLIRLPVLSVVLLTSASFSHAEESVLAAPLCGILEKLMPEVKAYKPEGAQAQLVLAVAQKFDYDPDKLQQVSAEIDQATSASCPKDREAMLNILQMKSLAEAVR